MYFLEVKTKRSNSSQHSRILLPKPPENNGGYLRCHVVDPHALGLNIAGEGVIQLFQSSEREGCFKMGQIAVLYGQSLTIFEVMDEGFVVFRL